MTAVDRCEKCNASLGTTRQGGLPGICKTLCIDCETAGRVAGMLDLLPDPTEAEWHDLDERTQEFLTSIRRQFGTEKRRLTEKQYQRLEDVYRRENR